MPDAQWRAAVVGPGGVGGLLGALLARAGQQVEYVAPPATATVLNSDGLTVRSAQFGQFHVPATATSTLSGPVDACLLTVKATMLADALAAVPPTALGDDGLVCPFLNGLDHMSLLRRRFPAAQVVAGAIQVESTRVAPGRIEHTSSFCRIELASDTAAPGRVETLAVRLRRAGLDVTVRESEAAVLWDKLAFLAPLALLTTHAGAPIGAVRERRRADLEAVIREVAEVARGSGGRVEPATVAGAFERLPAGMKSSMQRDAEARRPIELDAIGGAVLRAAQRHGVATPVTQRLVDDLRARAAGGAAG